MNDCADTVVQFVLHNLSLCCYRGARPAACWSSHQVNSRLCSSLLWAWLSPCSAHHCRHQIQFWSCPWSGVWPGEWYMCVHHLLLFFFSFNISFNDFIPTINHVHMLAVYMLPVLTLITSCLEIADLKITVLFQQPKALFGSFSWSSLGARLQLTGH